MPTTFTLDDSWTSAALSEPGRVLRVRLRPPSNDWMANATMRVDIAWRVSWSDRLRHGGPSFKTDAKMIALERRLATAVEATGVARLQIVDTCDGVRTWTFYARDVAPLADLVETAVNAGVCPKLAVSFAADPNWTADAAARAALTVPKTVVAPAPVRRRTSPLRALTGKAASASML